MYVIYRRDGLLVDHYYLCMIKACIVSFVYNAHTLLCLLIIWILFLNCTEWNLVIMTSIPVKRCVLQPHCKHWKHFCVSLHCYKMYISRLPHGALVIQPDIRFIISLFKMTVQNWTHNLIIKFIRWSTVNYLLNLITVAGNITKTNQIAVLSIITCVKWLCANHELYGIWVECYVWNLLLFTLWIWAQFDDWGTIWELG